MLIQAPFFGYDLEELLYVAPPFFLSKIPANRGRRTGRQAQIIATAGSIVQIGKVSIVLSMRNSELAPSYDKFSEEGFLTAEVGILEYGFDYPHNGHDRTSAEDQ